MNLLRFLSLPFLLAGLWFWVSASELVPVILLPHPLDVLSSAIDSVTDGSLLKHCLASARRSLSGFFLAAIFGVTLGLLFVRNPRLYQISYLSIEALRVTPPLALVPLLILWLGIDEAPKVAIVFLSSFFPIYLNTLSAVASIDKKLVEVGQLLGFTSLEQFKLLILPSALPGILSGLRLGFGYSWRALVGAELIAASSGLGFLISESAEFAKTDVVFIGILTIALLGVMADFVLSRLCQSVIHHRL